MTGVVVNPRAGRGRAGREWPLIERALRRAFGSIEVRVTSAPGDGARLACELTGMGADLIVAAGGDGTCSEIANSSCRCLGILPVGSAGDFARTLGVPRRWQDAVEWLRAARPSAIDAGLAAYTSDSGARETRRFLNMASFGLGGRVVRRTGQPYLLSALRELREGTCADLELSLDGVDHRATLLHGAVGNGRYQGAGMHVCPRAAPDDGWLDFTAIEPVSLVELAVNLHKVYSGALLTHPKVRSWRVRSMAAASREPVALDLDGEPAGWLPAEFRILPSAMLVLR